MVEDGKGSMNAIWWLAWWCGSLGSELHQLVNYLVSYIYTHKCDNGAN